jgi:hypothetical protein
MTLRAELQSVTGRGGASLFPELRAIARGVARRLHPTSDAADDLVSGLLLELLTEGRDGGSGGVDGLLQLDDRYLRARVRRRLYQVALREKPRWKLYRALRLHVSATLAAPPPPPPSPPSSLVDGESGRLSRARVASAVAWLLAHATGPGVASATPRPTAKGLTAALLDIYFPLDSPLPELVQLPASEPDPERQAHRAAAAPALREQLRGAVGERKLAVFIRLCRGEGYREVAARFGISMATAHSWKEEVTQLLAARVRATHGSEGTVLELLRTPSSRPSADALRRGSRNSTPLRSRRAR